MASDMIAWVSVKMASECIKHVVGIDNALDVAADAALMHGHMAFVWSINAKRPDRVETAIANLKSDSTNPYALAAAKRPAGKSRRAAMWELCHPGGDAVSRMTFSLKTCNTVPEALQDALSLEHITKRAQLLDKLCAKFNR